MGRAARGQRSLGATARRVGIGPVNWRQDAGLFLCPCHGGVFYADGTVAGGPPERPLFERDWKVENGRLLVRPEALPTIKTKGT